MQIIESEQQFEQAIGAKQPTVAVFKTAWCKDCKFIEPFMPSIVEQHDDLTFIELDRDNFPQLCERLNILGIPSFIVFSQGRELVRFVSKLRKTREEIEQFLDRARAVAKAMPQQS